MSNKDKKTSGFIYFIIAVITVFILIGIFLFKKSKNDDKVKPELGTIDNTQHEDRTDDPEVNENSNDKKLDENENEEPSNNHEEVSDKISSNETNDEYIASQITRAIGNMVSNAIITEKYWNKQTNDDVIKTALNNNKINVEFDYSSDGMDNQLMVGPNTSMPLPVIEAKPVNQIKEFNESNMIKGYEVTKISDNEYSAKLRLIKCEVPTDYGMNLRELHSLTKQVLNDYEKQGTLNDHTYDEIEELKLTKQDNLWKVQFENPKWYIAKGENKQND